MNYDVLDMAAVRVQHSLLLLQLLWQQDAPRIDLSRQVGLSRSAISSIVQDLLASGLVQEGEARVSDRVGRRATMLSLNTAAAHLLSVDLGASHIRVALLNLRCELLASSERAHDIRSGPAATYPLIRTLALEVLSQAGVPQERVAAVGVGIPGPVDFRTGEVIRPPNMTGWDGENVARSLGAIFAPIFSAPVLVDNDANLGALAEWKFGELQGTPDLIYIKAATGIGAGVLLGGRLHRGVSGGAGEIGHISINEQGPLGRSGNPGSLESYAAAGVVLSKMRGRLHRYPDTTLHADSLMSDLTRLSTHDPLARELWSEVGRHLGVAITTSLNLFNPSAVLIGGQMAAAGEPLLAAVRQVVQERAMQVNRGEVRIAASTLGRDIGALGAGVMMLERLFSPAGIGQLTRVSLQTAANLQKVDRLQAVGGLQTGVNLQTAGLHGGSRAPPVGMVRANTVQNIPTPASATPSSVSLHDPPPASALHGLPVRPSLQALSASPSTSLTEDYT